VVKGQEERVRGDSSPYTCEEIDGILELPEFCSRVYVKGTVFLSFRMPCMFDVIIDVI
jgi:hypothetical protein